MTTKKKTTKAMRAIVLAAVAERLREMPDGELADVMRGQDDASLAAVFRAGSDAAILLCLRNVLDPSDLEEDADVPEDRSLLCAYCGAREIGHGGYCSGWCAGKGAATADMTAKSDEAPMPEPVAEPEAKEETRETLIAAGVIMPKGRTRSDESQIEPPAKSTLIAGEVPGLERGNGLQRFDCKHLVACQAKFSLRYSDKGTKPPGKCVKDCPIFFATMATEKASKVFVPGLSRGHG